MNTDIVAALIEAGGSVLAAMIGVAGLLAIFKHRLRVDTLAKEVSAYYHHETQLVVAIFRLRNPEQEPDETKVKFLRGKLRSEFATDQPRPTMSAVEANKARKRILN